MWPMVFLPEARRDFDESFDWYAARNQGAATGFSNEVDKTLARICADPAIFPSLDGVHQACPVGKYPFRVVFRKLDEQILIVAIAHSRRRPGFWQERVD